MGQFEQADLHFNYEEMGHPETPLVVLLHDFGEEARRWYPVMRELESYYHVVAPDLRGHGRSASPESLDQYSMEAYASDLEALLDHLGADLAAIAGWGFGGMVALQFATADPDRVAALCLSDSSPAPGSDRYAPEFGAAEAEVDRIAEEVRAFGMRVLSRKQAAEVRDQTLGRAITAQAVGRSADGWLGAAHARKTRPDLIDRLRGKLSMPVLICTGDEDPLRSASDVMREEISGARSVVFEDTGHGIPLARPHAFADVLSEFLSDVEQGFPVEDSRSV